VVGAPLENTPELATIRVAAPLTACNRHTALTARTDRTNMRMYIPPKVSVGNIAHGGWWFNIVLNLRVRDTQRVGFGRPWWIRARFTAAKCSRSSAIRMGREEIQLQQRRRTGKKPRQVGAAGPKNKMVSEGKPTVHRSPGGRPIKYPGTRGRLILATRRRRRLQPGIGLPVGEMLRQRIAIPPSPSWYLSAACIPYPRGDLGPTVAHSNK
jgi:hypothetical protein